MSIFYTHKKHNRFDNQNNDKLHFFIRNNYYEDFFRTKIKNVKCSHTYIFTKEKFKKFNTHYKVYTIQISNHEMFKPSS